MQDIECVFESVSSKGSLFISNLPAAKNLQLLQSKGIKAILSVARSGLVNHRKQDIPHYLFIPAEDVEDYLISQHFEQTYHFIEKARKQTNVLIHCMAGVSRSATIIIAYLLKKYKYTLGQVITMIQRKRRKLNPNKGFIQQLKKYSEDLGIKCDFHGIEVYPLKQASNSKQIRTYSANKQKTPIKKVEPLTPILHMSKNMRRQKINQNNIFSSEDLVNPVIKSNEIGLKKVRVKDERFENNEEQCSNTKLLDSSIQKGQKVNHTPIIEKSLDKKRLSIEEKISKIRQRLIKSDQIHRKDTIIKFQSTNPLKVERNEKQSISNKKKNHQNHSKIQINQYQQANSKDLKSYFENSINSLKKCDELNFYPEQSCTQIFEAELKIQSKTFYHNIQRSNPRMNPKIREQLNH